MKAWCGFVDGKPDLDLRMEASHRTPDGYCQLYRTRKEAEHYYQDVRRVEIRECQQRLHCHPKG